MAFKNKIRSRKGASITFALLAFMVCAVIGSVVLSAALASAGRAKDLEDADRRYYAVTSAAQLFADALSGQEYSVYRVEVDTSVVTYQHELESDGNYKSELVESDDESDKEYSLKLLRPGDAAPADVSAETLESSFLAEAAVRFVTGSGSADAGDAFDAESDSGFDRTGTWSMILQDTVTEETVEGETVTDPGYTCLAVKVEATMSADGTIEFVFTNNDSASSPFSVKLILKAGVRDNSDLPDVTASVESVVSALIEEKDAETNEVTRSYYEETVTTTKTTTKTTQIKWTASEIKKVSA